MLLIIYVMRLSYASCLQGYQPDPSYPGQAQWTMKIWNENLFTAQVMRILLNDVFDQDVEFFPDNTNLADVLKTMAGTEKGFDSKDAYFWNLISEVSLPMLRNTSEYSNKFLILPLGSGAPIDYYKVIHPGLGLQLPYISHVLNLVSFASEKIDESYFIKYYSPDEAYNASCRWLQENTDLISFWTPWIEFKEIEYVLLYFTGSLLMFMSFASIFILWLLLSGIEDIQRSFATIPGIKDESSGDSRKKWIKAGDVKGLAFICAGCFISGNLVFLANRASDMHCNTFPFVMHGGVLFVIGSLTVRTDKLVRIYNIAVGKTPSFKIKISFWHTWFAWVILPSAIVATFLLLCLLLVPLKSTWFIYDESFYRECGLSENIMISSEDGFITTEKIIFGAPMIFEGFLVLRLVRLLWNLDGLEEQYNENSQILCVLLVLGIVITASCIVEIISMNPYTKDTFQIAMLLSWYFFVQAFMSWPRLWRAYMNREIKESFVRNSHMEIISARKDLAMARSQDSHTKMATNI
jgi:hypothetical protein